MTDLLYILAASHSGSTLLAMLLGAHPDVCAVGELKATSLGDVDRYRCSCGELIKECGFWARVSDGMARRGFSFDITDAGTDFRSSGTAYTRRLLRPLHRGPFLERVRDAGLWLSSTWRARLPLIQQRNAALVATLSEVRDAKVVLDSSKISLRLKYLLRNPQINVKVVRLIRDGRGGMLTYMDPAQYADATDPRLREGGMGGDRAGQRLSAAEAAGEWRRSNEEAEHLLAGLDPSRWLTLNYEALCANPDQTLNRVFRFLEVDPSRWVRAFRQVEHHVVGNGMRLDSESEIRIDERWREVLSEGDRAVFDSVAGDLNRKYGYA